MLDKLDFHSYVAKQMFNLSCDVNEVKQAILVFRKILSNFNN